MQPTAALSSAVAGQSHPQPVIEPESPSSAAVTAQMVEIPHSAAAHDERRTQNAGRACT